MKNKLLKYLAYGLGLALLIRRDRPSGTPGERAPEPQKTEPPVPGPVARQPAPEADNPPKGVIDYFKRTFQAFGEDDCMNLAAAVAYYTVFSLPPLLLLIIAVAGMVFGRAAVQHQIQLQAEGLIGSGAAGQIEIMVKSAAQTHYGSIIGAAVGIIALIFGATGAFIALQDALNKIWHVKPDPKAGGIRIFIGKRILSFGLILGVGFLLLVSLAVSAALAAFGDWIAGMMPAFVSSALLQVMGALVSLAIITFMFAAMFRLLPDADIKWREVWVGAVITGLLFTIGKTAIGLYLGHSGAASAYGAAGSLMLIVLWLYYASVIFLCGAEFTKLWALAHGSGIKPEPGAVAVINEERHAHYLEPAR